MSSSIICKNLCFVAFVSVLAGCVKEVEPQLQDENSREVVFHAGWDSETRTVLQEDGSVWWSPGDSISVFVGDGANGGYKFLSTSSEASAETYFTGKIDSKSSGKSYIAVYPYNSINNVLGKTVHAYIPPVQVAVEGTFGNGDFVSIAQSDNEELYFSNICSGMKFSVTSSGIKKIVISPRDGSSLVGYFDYSLDSGEYDKATSSTVEVTAPGDSRFEPGKYYYAVFLPFKSESGVNITYYTENEVGVFEYAHPIEFKRSVFKRLYDKDAELQFHCSKSIFKTNMILPDGIDKSSITQAIFLTDNQTQTGTIISGSVEDGYEPIYFEQEGTTVKYYTAAASIVISDAHYMFEDWTKLQSLDLTSFETGQCHLFGGMFSNCASLVSLDISSFDISRASDMNLMFKGCSNLINLNLGEFKNKVAECFNGVFSGCKSLTELDLSGLDSPGVENFNFLFYGCSSLVSVKMPGIYNQCTGLQGVFSGCRSLENIQWGNVNTSNVTSMNGMFLNCANITEINLEKFDFSNVTDMSSMFNCGNLQKLTLPDTPTKKLTNMESIFGGCAKLTELDLSIFETSNVTDMSYAFNACGVKHYDFSNFVTTNVKTMFCMFGECYATELDLSSFDTSNVENMASMFSKSRAKSIDLSSFNTEKVSNMSYMFSSCHKLTELDLSSFKTSQVTTMESMFLACNELKNLKFSNISTESLTSTDRMFSQDLNLLTIDLGDSEISSTVSHNSCCSIMSKLSGTCAIKASDSFRTLLQDGELDSAVKVIWVGADESMPEMSPLIDSSLYYSSDFSRHCEVEVIQQASEGKGIDIVLMGDAYSDRLIDDGTYLKDANRVISAIFSAEPYASYKHLFNIYLVYLVSSNELTGKNTALVCNVYEGTTLITSDSDGMQWEYGRLASQKKQNKFYPIVFVNDDSYHGTASLAFSVGGEENTDHNTMFITMDSQEQEFSSTAIHEFGHSFGFLADEYPSYDEEISSSAREDAVYLTEMNPDIYRNIDFTDSTSEVKWSKFLDDDRYSNENLGTFEGAFGYSQGVWRSSDNSVMRAGSSYNAPSREAIYLRIHKLAFGDSWMYDWETFVQQDLKNVPATASMNAVKTSARNNGKSFFKIERQMREGGQKIVKITMD